MKRILLLTVLSVLSFCLYSQSKDLYLNETFNGADWPEGWKRLNGWHYSGNDASFITLNNYNCAGGDPREVCFQHTWATANRTGRLLSKIIDMPNVAGTMILEFLYSIERYFDEPVLTIGVGTTIDDGETWNIIWQLEQSGSFQVQCGKQFSVSEEVESPDFGESNMRLIFFCTCSDDYTMTVIRWYFDNVRLYSVLNHDAALLSIDKINEFSTQGRNEVGFTFANKGTQTIHSLQASYQFEGMPKVTQVFNDLNVEQNGKYTLTFSEKTILSIDNYLLNVSIDKINGQDDQEPADNSKSMEVKTYMALAEKRLVIDYFSSSTCGVCPIPNRDMKEFLDRYPDYATISKYIVPIPTSGDPYVNDDAAIRRTYYSVGSVPSVFFNGTSILSGGYEEYFNIYSPKQIPIVELRGNFWVDNKTIKIDFNIAAYENIENAVLHVAVNEKITTGNVGTNGETEFYHVMMKMLPNGNGTPVSLKRYDVKNFSFEYDLSSTHVEEFDDLEVNVFIQDIATKNIYNGNWLLERDLLENAPPTEVELHQIETKSKEAYPTKITWKAPANEKVVGYNLYINDELFATNIATTFYNLELSRDNSELDVVKVSAVYPNSVESVRVAEYKVIWHISVDEYLNSKVTIYPNPAENIVNIDAEKAIKGIEIFNITGQLQFQVNPNTNHYTVNISDFVSGIYFFKIMFEDGSSVNHKIAVR